MIRIAPPLPVVETGRIRGEVIYVDGFGNLVTNVDEPTLARGGRGSVVVRGTRMQGVQESYAAVARGEPLAVVNSWGLVEIAVRDGSAAKKLAAGVGEPVTIEAE
jgi:hypothetical protein